MRNLWTTGLALGASLAACSGTTTTTSMDMASSSTPDMAIALPATFTGEGNNMGPAADWSCLGNFQDPAAPTDKTLIHGVVKDFQDDNLVVGATVRVYTTTADALADKAVGFSVDLAACRAANIADLDCTKPGLTDDKGEYDMIVPPGSYRIIRSITGGMAVSNGNMVPMVHTFEFNMKFDDKGPTAVKQSTIEAIPGLVSVVQDDANGILAGAVHDCKDAETGGAHLQATSGTAYDTDSSDKAKQLMFYFVKVSGSTIPTRVQKFTSGNGAFAALNVGVDSATGQATGSVVATGIATAGGARVELSKASVPVLAHAITIVHLSANGSGK